MAITFGIAVTCLGISELVTEPARAPAPLDIGSVPVHTGPAEAAEPGKQGSAAPPVRIRIPAIGLDQPLTGVRVQQDGRLGAPPDPSTVSWWSDGPIPGNSGAAIVVGHVDSTTGPGAFHGLSALRPGDRITVARNDRSHVIFTVQALRQYEKDAFPDSKVYATTGPPALHLITCSGTYDRTRGEYRSNLVVYATTA
ncbi:MULTISPECIES: class F sortase [unclassified Streptomyces]|uniref:class F sortase n=1 Tax=unclassified Streptomyces TaxID=2593676 RepID=UPI002034D377|nr:MULTISPECIES: class F sortase [unclassified Streptomyces]